MMGELLLLRKLRIDDNDEMMTDMRRTCTPDL